MLFFLILILILQPQSVLSQDEKTIVFLGDSITAGISGTNYLPYLEQIGAPWNESRLVNSGQNGLAASDLFGDGGKIMEKVSNFNPQYVIVFLGSVDLSYRNATDFQGYYNWLLDELYTQLPSVNLLLVEFPWMDRGYDEFFPSYHAVIHKAAGERELPLAYLYNSTINKTNLFVDGIHPNDDGAEIFAQIIHDEFGMLILSSQQPDTGSEKISMSTSLDSSITQLSIITSSVPISFLLVFWTLRRKSKNEKF